MPQNGEKNALFGVYESACCGAEIVITVGAEFPACPNHRNLTTAWNQIEITTADVIVLNKKSKAEPAA